MKIYLNVFLGLFLLTGIVFAVDCYTTGGISSKISSTNSVSTPAMEGYVDAIIIKVTSGTLHTGLYNIVTADHVLLTNAVVSGTATTLRPRTQVHKTDGNVLGATTNGWERILLAKEPITIYVEETAPATNTISVKIVTDDK